MIRLGLRLTAGSGREGLIRLAITAVGVALGVGMLLVALAGINAVNAQNDRYAWLETGSVVSDQPAPGVDPLWWRLSADVVHGQLIGKVDVAVTGTNSPLPPGLEHVPAPGQYVASPALARLLVTLPRDQLADRFPGRLSGTLRAAALPSPSTLLVVVGRTPAELRAEGGQQVTAISTVPPSSCNGACLFVGVNASGIDLILAVVVAALLFPVVIFIGTATRLSAARREQRFAAMRLVGATPRQVAVIAAVESTIAAVIGAAGGFGLFLALRPAVVHINFTGAQFYPRDLSLNIADIVVIGIGVPVAAAAAACLALNRVRISPLGVEQRVTPPRPRALRVIPLILGLAELGWFVSVGRPDTSQGQLRAYLPGFLLVMIGLILAGPWLTMIGARVLARRSNRSAGLIAGRRLADDPRAGFRAISGLILALFVTSVAVGTMTTIHAYTGGQRIGSPERHTLVDDLSYTENGAANAHPIRGVAELVAKLRATPGVSGVTELHGVAPTEGTIGPPHAYVNCAQLRATPALGHCPAGAAAAIYRQAAGKTRVTGGAPTFPTTSLSTEGIRQLPVRVIAVATTNSAAVERARTDLDRAFPSFRALTIAEQAANEHGAKLISEFQQLADVVIVISLAIAGCTLAVSVANGISTRRRPFSLLRLTGAPLSMLRRVVGWESVVPLMIIAALSIGAGFASTAMFVNSQLHETLQPPGVGYFIVVVAGLLSALALIASTLPLLDRLTGPEAARND